MLFIDDEGLSEQSEAVRGELFWAENSGLLYFTVCTVGCHICFFLAGSIFPIIIEFIKVERAVYVSHAPVWCVNSEALTKCQGRKRW